MTAPKADPAWSRVIRRVLSVPIFIKILGIGVIVAAFFGGVTFFQIRGSISRQLYQGLEQRAVSFAQVLAANLERPLVTGDIVAVNRALEGACKRFPEIRYIVVRDTGERVVAHTFTTGVPPDIQTVFGAAGDGKVSAYSSAEGLLFDLKLSILDGRAGSVQVAVTDNPIRRDIDALLHSLEWNLGLCMALGCGLAFILTYFLTRPIYHLIGVTRDIGAGKFEIRARITSDDEIGRLAEAFNQMIAGLERYRQEVRDKEDARLALLDKIVQTQENERQTLSRELHDQLGHSLLMLLLNVQAHC